MPELKPESDLEQVYNHNRRWFFGLLAAVTVISLLDDLFLSGKVRFDLNGGMRLLLLLICIMAFGLRAKRAQLPIAVVFLVTLLSYIALVFWKL